MPSKHGALYPRTVGMPKMLPDLIESQVRYFLGSGKNVGVADTSRITEPFHFLKNAVFINSYGSIPQPVP